MADQVMRTILSQKLGEIDIYFKTSKTLKAKGNVVFWTGSKKRERILWKN